MDLKPFTWGWFHTYKPIEYKQLLIFEFDSDELPCKRKTEILGQCIKCGRLKTKTLKGNWSLK